MSLKNMQLPDDFDGNEYLELHPDVKASGMDPVEHYINYGIAEGRKTKREISNELNQVSEFWGVERAKSGLIFSWLQHPILQSYYRLRVTGSKDVDFLTWLKMKYIPNTLDLGLSLGCGFGGFERHAMKIGICRTFDAFDISEQAIASAKQEAKNQSLEINYAVRDLDEIQLPPRTYDLIVADSSAHHIYNLENYFKNCKCALKDDGLFYMNEYIGPSRFQTSETVSSIINELLALLPRRYRNNLLSKGLEEISQYVPSTVDHFESTDPSEAVRSAELINTLKLYFDVVCYRPYGGAILHMLLSGIAGNFCTDIESDVTILKIISLLEKRLEDAGAIGSDFAVVVAKPKR
jgi:SAM-dependent methyltransferase